MNQILISIPKPTIDWKGGAYNAPPLADFLNNLKSRKDIDAKLRIPYQTSIWDLYTSFSKIRREVFEKMAF